ncbi:four helix bundle protein [bacterium]|nr:four helix bundle protein [bacterium]
MTQAEAFKARTKQFALRTIRLVNALPKSSTAETIGRQLLRSAMSVGANYRAACRAQSKAAFIAKLAIVHEECDEAIYWLELLVESNIVRHEKLADLEKEANEILAIVVASMKTARANAAASAIRKSR